MGKILASEKYAGLQKSVGSFSQENKKPSKSIRNLVWISDSYAKITRSIQDTIFLYIAKLLLKDF